MFALSFQYLYIAIFLYNVNANIFVNIENDGENSILGSHLYYESELKNFTYEVKSLNRDNHLMRRELDAVSFKMDKEMSAQMDQLLEIQKILEEKKVKKTAATKAPTSCAEAMQLNSDHTHGGVYTLHLPDFPPFEVFCLKDPNNGPAWTIIQRRQDGTMDFFLKWVDYKNGFGNLYDEFWLGLDKIHALTKVTKQQLWILLEDYEGETRHAYYDAFAIGDYRSKYLMHTLGVYSGDTGDALRTHYNNKFSTRDADNDGDPYGHCAKNFAGGWWFSSCSNTDLNGLYIRNQEHPDVLGGKSVEWTYWRDHYSLKHVHMAIRPVV